MLFEALDNLFKIFFPESLMLNYPIIFTSFKILFLILFLIFIFFGLASLASKK